MSTQAPIIIEQSKGQDVQTLSYLIIFKLAWFIMLIAFPALKTYSVVIEEEDPKAKGFQIKWGYYWVTAPYLILLFKLFDWILGKYIAFHLVNLMITFILTRNNGYYVRQITVKLTAKLYKTYYRQIKDIPDFLGNLLKNISMLFLNAIFKAKKDPKEGENPVPRRTKFE